MKQAIIFLLIIIILFTTACSTPEPETITIRETIIAEVPVTVEVTREVETEIEVTREVQVTREIVVTATPTLTPTPEPTATPSPPAPLEERIIGKWSGAQTSSSGDKIPATWQFFSDGTMNVTLIGMGVSYGAEWWVDGNRINLVTELAPDNPTYRDAEFLDDNIIRLTKDESDITETWTRVEE